MFVKACFNIEVAFLKKPETLHPLWCSIQLSGLVVDRPKTFLRDGLGGLDHQRSLSVVPLLFTAPPEDESNSEDNFQCSFNF